MEGVKRIDFVLPNATYRRRFPFTFVELVEEAAILAKVSAEDVLLTTELRKQKLQSTEDYYTALKSAPLSGLRLVVETFIKAKKPKNPPVTKTASKPKRPQKATKELYQRNVKPAKADCPVVIDRTKRLEKRQANSKATPKSKLTTKNGNAQGSLHSVPISREPDQSFKLYQTVLVTNSAGTLIFNAINSQAQVNQSNSQVLGSGRSLLLSTGHVIYTGGNPNRKDCCLINTQTGATVQKSGLKQGRYFHGITELANGEVLIAGGNSNDEILSSTEIFDGKSWRNGPNMIRQRSSVTIVTVKEKVYAIGGRIAKPRIYTYEIEVLHYVWTILPVNLREAVISVGAAGWGDDLFIFGGQTSNSNLQSSTIKINTQTFEVTRCDDMPSCKKFPTTHAISEAGLIFCVGKFESEVLIFNTADLNWSKLKLF